MRASGPRACSGLKRVAPGSSNFTYNLHETAEEAPQVLATPVPVASSATLPVGAKSPAAKSSWSSARKALYGDSSDDTTPPVTVQKRQHHHEHHLRNQGAQAAMAWEGGRMAGREAGRDDYISEHPPDVNQISSSVTPSKFQPHVKVGSASQMGLLSPAPVQGGCQPAAAARVGGSSYSSDEEEHALSASLDMTDVLLQSLEQRVRQTASLGGQGTPDDSVASDSSLSFALACLRLSNAGGLHDQSFPSSTIKPLISISISSALCSKRLQAAHESVKILQILTGAGCPSIIQDDPSAKILVDLSKALNNFPGQKQLCHDIIVAAQRLLEVCYISINPDEAVSGPYGRMFPWKQWMEGLCLVFRIGITLDLDKATTLVVLRSLSRIMSPPTSYLPECVTIQDARDHLQRPSDDPSLPADTRSAYWGAYKAHLDAFTRDQMGGT